MSTQRAYSILERLLLLSQEELRIHTLHRFAALLEVGEDFQRPAGGDPAFTDLSQLPSRSREAHFLPVHFIRVCPLRLQEPVCYDRLYWRVRQISHYFSPRTLSEIARDEVLLPGDVSYSILAHLLQIPREDIPHLTGSDLISSLELPRYNDFRHHALLTEHDLQFWLLPHLHDTTRVCPYCVEERQGYDRVFWNLRGVLCCPHHGTRLLEKCPVCLQAIPAIRPLADQCPFCSRATYGLAAKRIPKDSAPAAGTDLLLTKLGIPPPETTSAFQFFGSSPLLDEKPFVYFALLIELMEEVASYYDYSQEQLLQLCHLTENECGKGTALAQTRPAAEEHATLTR